LSATLPQIGEKNTRLMEGSACARPARSFSLAGSVTPRSWRKNGVMGMEVLNPATARISPAPIA
jgi:hypothetical protein